MRKENIISDRERLRYKSTTTTLPRLYGLPKIHKDGLPLRPICSCYNGPSTNLSRFLTKILKNLTAESKFKFNIKDSTEFQEKLKDIQIGDSERLVSFDVVSLFPSVPVELAIGIIMKKWETIKNYTNMSKEVFKKILDFCIKESRVLKFGDRIYKQLRGLPMGSPASPIVADIVLEELLF